MMDQNDDAASPADERERYRELRRELRKQKAVLKAEKTRLRSHERQLRRDRKSPFSVERLRENLRNRFERLAVSVRVHGFVFLLSAAFLIALNLFTSPGVLWSFYPIGGWAIGLGAHLQALFNRRREVKQLSKVQNVQDETIKILRRYQRSVGAWNQHRTAFLLTGGYLFGVNLWTMLYGGYFFLWALIPLGAWAIGLGCHWMANGARRRRLADELAGDGLPVRTLGGGRIGVPRAADAGTTLSAKARAVREELLAHYRNNDALRLHAGEVEPLLDTLVEQIDMLEKKRAQFDALMKTFSVDELEEELEQVRRKERTAADELLKREYRRSIAQYESHLKAAYGLARHRELLDVRLTSAFRLITQLEIDTVRLLSMDSVAEPSSLSALRAKTEETRLFLDDFEKAMSGLEGGGEPPPLEK